MSCRPAIVAEPPDGLMGLGGLFDEVQSGAMFLHPLFHRQDLVPQLSQLVQLLLNLLQAFMSLTVGNLGVGQIPASQSILLVQFLNLGDFDPEPAYLVAENFEMIHAIRITHPGVPNPCPSQFYLSFVARNGRPIINFSA